MTAPSRVEALIRLATAEAVTNAQLEGCARAAATLVSDRIAGRPCPLSTAELRTALEQTVGREPTSARGVSAVLRAADALAKLDAHEEDPGGPFAASNTASDDEVDIWFDVDLWPTLVLANGWQGCALTDIQEDQIARDYEEIIQSSRPALALDAYRRSRAR